MRRLVTYWILFSMISLFEQTFNNLLQWVPVWPYAKILVIFWLIIPDFYGSTIAYNSIVRPRFYMQLLQEAMDMLYKKQYISLQKVSFLAVAERFVHEHGDEALEKPISIKQPEIEELKCARKDQIKAVEIQNESAGDTKNKNVQKEWTCAVCQVTTNSETTLNSHLGGLRHKTRCEELKAGKQTMSKKDVAIGKPNIGMKCTICEVTTQSVATMISHLQGMKHKSKREEIETKEPAEESNNQNFNNGQNKFGGANKDIEKDYSSSDGPSTMFACNICQVKLNNEVSFKSHLLGKKHKSKCLTVQSKRDSKKGK